MKTTKISTNIVNVEMTLQDMRLIQTLIHNVKLATAAPASVSKPNWEYVKQLTVGELELINKLEIPNPPLFKKGEIKKILQSPEQKDFFDFCFGGFKATLVKGGEKIAVWATLEHPAVSYGQPIWVDKNNNPICQVDMEGEAGYELVF